MSLPMTIKERVDLVLEQKPAPTQKRILVYLVDHPDSFTHTLSEECAVGYPPARLHELNNNLLPRYGLKAICTKPKKWLTNRYGEESRVHQWKLVKTSNRRDEK